MAICKPLLATNTKTYFLAFLTSFSVRHIPLLVRRGGCASKKKTRSHPNGADGVVAYGNNFCERPPRPLHSLRLRAIALALRAKEASQHFIDVASTPPHEEGNTPSTKPFGCGSAALRLCGDMLLQALRTKFSELRFKRVYVPDY